MKAKTKFLKIYKKLPEDARRLLVYSFASTYPYSINVIAEEVKKNTKLGKKILEELGFEDD